MKLLTIKNTLLFLPQNQYVMNPTLDEAFIRKVNLLARKNALQDFDPFAALLVKDREVVYQTADKSIVYSDPTAHAELVAISEYCREKGLIELKGYSLYCNVEPCVMCSGAIHWSRISRVVFSITQSMLQSFSGGTPKPSSDHLINIGKTKIEVVGPVLPAEGLQVFKDFPFRSKSKRHAAYRNHIP